MQRPHQAPPAIGLVLAATTASAAQTIVALPGLSNPRPAPVASPQRALADASFVTPEGHTITFSIDEQCLDLHTDVFTPEDPENLMCDGDVCIGNLPCKVLYSQLIQTTLLSAVEENGAYVAQFELRGAAALKGLGGSGAFEIFSTNLPATINVLPAVGLDNPLLEVVVEADLRAQLRTVEDAGTAYAGSFARVRFDGNLALTATSGAASVSSSSLMGETDFAFVETGNQTGEHLTTMTQSRAASWLVSGAGDYEADVNGSFYLSSNCSGQDCPTFQGQTITPGEISAVLLGSCPDPACNPALTSCGVTYVPAPGYPSCPAPYAGAATYPTPYALDPADDRLLMTVSVRVLGEDCDGNFIPDADEIAANPTLDWNDNDVLDVCDIESGVLTDCDNPGEDGYAIPDECEIAQGALDWNMNDLKDVCEIRDGLLGDCDGDGEPDGYEIEQGTAFDCNCDGPDGVPDFCQGAPDYNGDLVPDWCEVAAGAPDCNGNWIPDEYDIEYAIDVDGLAVIDCNNNGIPDRCEIQAIPILDADGDGLLDNCVPRYLAHPLPATLELDVPVTNLFFWEVNSNGRAVSMGISSETGGTYLAVFDIESGFSAIRLDDKGLPPGTSSLPYIDDSDRVVIRGASEWYVYDIGAPSVVTLASLLGEPIAAGNDSASHHDSALMMIGSTTTPCSGGPFARWIDLDAEVSLAVQSPQLSGCVSLARMPGTFSLAANGDAFGFWARGLSFAAVLVGFDPGNPTPSPIGSSGLSWGSSSYESVGANTRGYAYYVQNNGPQNRYKVIELDALNETIRSIDVPPHLASTWTIVGDIPDRNVATNESGELYIPVRDPTAAPVNLTQGVIWPDARREEIAFLIVELVDGIPTEQFRDLPFGYDNSIAHNGHDLVIRNYDIAGVYEAPNTYLERIPRSDPAALDLTSDGAVDLDDLHAMLDDPIDITGDAIAGIDDAIRLAQWLIANKPQLIEDCNDNAQPDLLELVPLGGTLPDSDGDLRPDTCPPLPTCIADLDGDDDTDVFDFNLFGPAFGASLGDPNFNPAADLNNDNTIDVFDFNLFAPDFGCGAN